MTRKRKPPDTLDPTPPRKEGTAKKFSEILQQAIDLAKEAYEARLNGDSDDDELMVVPGKLRYPEERRLDAFFKAQPASVIYMLTAVMDLGRGDFNIKALRDRYMEVSETFGGKEWAARLMLEKGVLPKYLEAGQKALDQAHVDVDELLSA